MAVVQAESYLYSPSMSCALPMYVTLDVQCCFQFFQLCSQQLVSIRSPSITAESRARSNGKYGHKTHILTVRSRPPLTSLSATKSTQYTSSVCPGRSVLILYVLRSQICQDTSAIC